MRSAIHDTFGEPAEVLKLGDGPVPEPQSGEVRIRTILAPIHNHDLWTVRGRYGYKPALPAIGGSEAVGVIDAVGDGVEGLAVGQRVAAASVHGTWAQFFLAPARMAVPVPDAIADETAAQLVAMPLSALMLLETLKLQPGQWIVQNAANGAVGKALAMLRTARGLRVLSLVRRDASADALKALDVADVLSTAQADWKDQARTILGPALASAGIESVGGQASADLLSLLGEGGTLVSFGSMGGEAMRISSADLIFRHLTVRGFWGSKVSQTMAIEDKRRLTGELAARALDGTLKLPVEAIYDLADIAKAAAASLGGERKGKVLLRP